MFITCGHLQAFTGEHILSVIMKLANPFKLFQMVDRLDGVKAMRPLGTGVILSLGDTVFRLCPRKWRFPLAIRLSIILGQLVRRSTLYRPAAGSLLGFRDHTLRIILDRLIRQGIEFDFVLTVRGAEHLSAEGIILVSGHIYLNLLFMRWLQDHGRRISLVMANPEDRTPLIDKCIPSLIKADAWCLNRIRRHVAEGEIVAVALDSPKPGKDAHKIDALNAPVFISSSIFQFAERARIPILYFATHLTPKGEVVTNIVNPSSPQATIATDELCLFLNSYLNQIDWQAS
ncbi:MAG TPA: hypothetical protein VEF04_13125 [Blastocatellia bacterium]|nr:hypothetical protein [Blastocatellia bacterium]